MDIGSKEFPGKIIKWSAIIGGIILFHEIIMYGLDTSFDGFDLWMEYMDIFVEWWDGVYYG